MKAHVRIPEHHPLRKFFGLLTEKSFTENLGWPDFNVTEYVSNLLVDFTHVDQLHRLRNRRGAALSTIVDMLYESEASKQEMDSNREEDVHRHIGDFTLFMAGIFPEYLKRIKTAHVVHHPDFLVDYVKTGKRSYAIVAQFTQGEFKNQTALYRKLSDNFELCVTGLGFVRSDLDRMQDPAFRKAKDILLH